MWKLLLILSAACLQDVSGFADGVPPKVCMNMFPKHHLDQQTTPSPYVIELSQSDYSPGDVITIKVSSQEKKTFRGFILRGRRLSGDTEQLVGDFIKYPDHVAPKSWYPLVEGQMNCICHGSNIDRESLEVEWRAPDPSVGDIEISGAFVHEFTQFWVTSNKLTLKSTQPTNEADYEAKIATADDYTVSVDECGKTKGCLLFPTGCSGNNCRHIVTYKIDENNGIANFEVSSKAKGYASVSLTSDKKMGEDETVNCIHGNDGADFQFGYNPEYYNEQHLRRLFKNIVISRQGDTLLCKYSRPLVTKLHNTTFDLRKPFYLVLAWGGIYEGTTVVKHHHELPIISNQKVDFTKHSIVHGSTFPVTYHAHAAMAIIAWIMLGCASVIIARHFKGTLKKLIGGAAVWFQVHRAIAFLIAALTVASIVIMFVYLKGWTHYATIHAILGFVATGLLLCQLIGGFLRPAGGHPRRPIFNWGHRIGGILALISAAVAVVLGFNVSLVEYALAFKETVIIIVWIAFHILFDFILEFVKCKADATKVDASDQKDGMKIEEGKKDAGISSRTMWILLAFYMLGNFVFCGVSLGFLFTS